MENPTIVVITDRNDLDDQLFATFARCAELLRQDPVQAESAAHLQAAAVGRRGRRHLHDDPEVPAGRRRRRFPLLTDRRNVVVIADEAHRSQYDFIDGFARNLRDALPNATFIGFTGHADRAGGPEHARPSSATTSTSTTSAARSRTARPSRSTTRAASRSSTSPEDEKPRVDAEFEEVTEGEEERAEEKTQVAWAALEALVGTEKRLALVAADLVEHLEEPDGGPRRQGDDRVHEPAHRVELYDELVRAAPGVARRDRRRGRRIKVVMTGSASDPRRGSHTSATRPAARRSPSAVRGSGRPAPDRHRPRHVADRLRRARACTRCTSTSRCTATG